VHGALAVNYQIAYQPGTLTVAREPMTTTARDGQIDASESLPALTASVGGLVAGDTRASALAAAPTCSAPGAGPSPAPGSYEIICAGAAAANYDITYRPGTLTVHSRTPARELTLATRRIVVVKPATRTVNVTCTIDQPRCRAAG
jgi:hypothetical protein